MELANYLMLVPLGLVAGACGGLLGIGGSVVMIPVMAMMLGRDQQHLYQATAMIVTFFVVAPAVIRHMRAGAVRWEIAGWMIPSAVGGAVVGVLLSELSVFRGTGQGYLQIAFAVFLGYVFIYNLLRLAHRTRPREERGPVSVGTVRLISICCVGIPTGLLGGLLGIGGGLFAVPLQQVGLRLPLPNAIANSAATILWSSVAGALMKNFQLSSHGQSWSRSMLMALCLIPTAMAGSWYASAKVHQWPIRVIRGIFAVLLLYCGSRLFIMGWQQTLG